jgi:large subunit ribosomal protein L29
MRAEKMRGIDATDLQRQANDAREQLFRFRFQMGMGQAEGLKKYRALKKDRARMLTILHEKAAQGELPEAQPAKKAAPAKGKAGKKAVAKSSADKKNKK